jgi:hypothetical protein
MAKMFYSLDEVAEELGMTEDQVKQLVQDDKLQQFRDRDKLMFKRDQVEAISGQEQALDSRLPKTMTPSEYYVGVNPVEMGELIDITESGLAEVFIKRRMTYSGDDIRIQAGYDWVIASRKENSDVLLNTTVGQWEQEPHGYVQRSRFEKETSFSTPEMAFSYWVGHRAGMIAKCDPHKTRGKSWIKSPRYKPVDFLLTNVGVWAGFMVIKGPHEMFFKSLKGDINVVAENPKDWSWVDTPNAATPYRDLELADNQVRIFVEKQIGELK